MKARLPPKTPGNPGIFNGRSFPGSISFSRFELPPARGGGPAATPAHALVRGAGAALGAALDLLLPPECLVCEAPVSAAGLFCADCFRATILIADPVCARCGLPFASTGAAGRDGICASCAAAPPRFATARAALLYDAGARRLILPFKHADRPEIAARLAPFLLRAGAALLDRADLLVPVPLHRRRLFSRRYNQAAVLALALGRRARRPVLVDALCRLRPTAPLGGKTAAEREAALDGAFAVRPRRAGALAGRCVLLIDDVLTSGATANACASVLLEAGARQVDVLAAARVPDPRGG